MEVGSAEVGNTEVGRGGRGDEAAFLFVSFSALYCPSVPLRVLGRWMRMITIPNQSSVAKAFQEFDEAGRMKPSAYYERIVDVMEELVRFTILTRPHAAQLVDRYSERKAAGIPLDAASDLSGIVIARQA